MSRQRVKSFDELQPQRTGSRWEGGGHELRVRASVAPQAGPAPLKVCRDLVLEWLRNSLQEDLPRKALRHRAFSLRTGTTMCKGVRVRDGDGDQWAVMIERNPAPDREIASEVVVSGTAARPGAVGIRVVDRSIAPGDVEREYPADLLAALAARIPLRQGGRRLAYEPVTVASEQTMRGFLALLLDPARQAPFAVLTLPSDAADRSAVETHAHSLARAVTGLAVVWVLPPAMTFRLTERVTRHLSVFNGAWRLYMPGFETDSSKTDHPLILWDRVSEEGGIARATERFLRASAEAVRQAGGGDHAPTYAELEREAARTTAHRGGLVSFLRRSIWGGADRVAVVREPPPAPTPAPAPESPGPSRRLRAARETATARARRYERVKKRVVAVEQERDEALKRAEQLAGLVRVLGGDPDTRIPFPTTWAEFPAWCDESLRGRLVLTGAARRELAGARFADVGLAARCLNWLAEEYRTGRLNGGNASLHGRIDGIDGAFNVPCGRDSFEHFWDGRRHTVNWHIKRGANTRDPRRCLRIYYFWDDHARQVIVAAMPGHRRNALS
ncbi:MAG: hypothetical protein OXU74_17675 [Gemmatimonadota bacterium]|nr:hypothetical protein [Gemmatimonadota bacterium]